MMAATYTGKLLGVLRTSGYRNRCFPLLSCSFYGSESRAGKVRLTSAVPKVRLAVPKVRLARLDDLPTVAAMTAHNPNFARQDYLITSFDKYLEDPYLRSMVSVLDGQATAFGSGYCGVDGGTSVVICTFRVSKEYREKGHTLLFYKVLHDMFPNCAFVFTSVKLPQARGKHLTTIIEHRNEYPFSATDAGMNQRASAKQVSPEDNNTVEPLTVHGFCELFNSNELNGYLYPNGRFIMDILVAQPLPTNEKLVQHRKDCIAIFISRSLQETTQQPIITSSENNGSSGFFKGLLSYNTWFPCPAGFISKIELYGQVDSCEDLRAHLKAHAQCFCDKRLWGEVKITVDRDRLSVDEVEFKRICQEVGFTAHDYPKSTRNLLVVHGF